MTNVFWSLGTIHVDKLKDKLLCVKSFVHCYFSGTEFLKVGSNAEMAEVQKIIIGVPNLPNLRAK